MAYSEIIAATPHDVAQETKTLLTENVIPQLRAETGIPLHVVSDVDILKDGDIQGVIDGTHVVRRYPSAPYGEVILTIQQKGTRGEGYI